MIAASQEEKQREIALSLLQAIVLLLLDSKKPQSEQDRSEVLLHRAGLPYKEIGRLLGKGEDAVRKAVERAKR